MNHYGEARPIGRMVPHAHQDPPPAPAACARCACNLSRYRDHWEHHCLTCSKVLVAEGELVVPAFEPAEPAARTAMRATTTPRTRNHKTRDQKLASRDFDTCTCGEPKRKGKPRCRACTNEAARVPGAKWSLRCSCGGPKSKGADLCMKCRYGIIAA